MNKNLIKIRNIIYDKTALILSSFETEREAYAAYRYKIGRLNIVCRDVKITPKKVG
jgi:hypothetical protein